jgi:hypothetical protein
MPSTAPGLTRVDIYAVVNDYIGVKDGYLGDFSYRTHTDFYPQYCDLDINPNEYPGTTRDRFIHILMTADPSVQAQILRGVLERFPVEGSGTRGRVRERILAMIARLDGTTGPVVASPAPRITSEVVDRALSDAESLLRTRGATSGVDRVHTALHGYLMALCDEAAIDYPTDSSVPTLFKLLRERHPSLRADGPRADDVTQVLRSLATIINSLGPVRNMASVAHPNRLLLKAPEAMLMFNVVRSILHYLDAKIPADR